MKIKFRDNGIRGFIVIGAILGALFFGLLGVIIGGIIGTIASFIIIEK